MSPLCVLVVDDSPDVPELLKRVPQLKAIEWHHAATLADADRMVAEVLPHIVILDLNLGPDSHGLTWLENSKDLRRRLPFQVIILSSSSQANEVRSALQLGAGDYVVKAEAAILAAKITAALQKLEPKARYAFEATGPEQMLPGMVSFDARVIAISETGFCLSSPVANSSPIDISQFDHTLFSEIGIEPPLRITFLNSIREAKAVAQPLRRNFCLVKGWRKSDLVILRKWMKDHHMTRFGA